VRGEKDSRWKVSFSIETSAPIENRAPHPKSSHPSPAKRGEGDTERSGVRVRGVQKQLRRRRPALRPAPATTPPSPETSPPFGAISPFARRLRWSRPRRLRRTWRTRLARRPRLLRDSGGGLVSAPATTTATMSCPFCLGLRRSLLLLRSTLRFRSAALGDTRTLRPLRPSITATLAWLLLLLLWPGVGSRGTSALRLLARSLLELLKLPLHVLANRAILAGSHLVETAVRAAFPTFGIGLPAGAAQDAFWQRHCRAGRIVHFRPCSLGTTGNAEKQCAR
jgi:hypothetical protein